MRMWEIREGRYGRDYWDDKREKSDDYRYGMKSSKEIYKCGYEDGYEEAMKELRKWD